MDYRMSIAAAISEALAAEPFSQTQSAADIEELLEVPRSRDMGDHAFPCFFLAKALRKGPPMIAADLAKILEPWVRGDDGIAEVQAVGPYVNFFVNKADLAAQVVPAILNGEFTEPRPRSGQRTMIEYSQPNTHKAFHVGHMRNVALGDALVRIAEWSGDEVVAANYIGDVGAHIAKCLWYYRTQFSGDVPATLRGEFLGDLYAKASDLLDPTLLTRAPHPKIRTARVTAIEPHPSNDKWQVVQVDSGSSKHSVVCGGSGFAVDDIVAYAPQGSSVGGRRVEVADKKGVPSDGMICSEKEISLGDDRNTIHVFPPDTPLGEEIIELMRIEGALPDDVRVQDVIAEREQGVTSVLKALEAGEPELTALWKETRQWSLDDFDAIYDWVGARFDHCFYESDVGDSGKAIVKEYYEKGVFVQSDGAIGADLTPFKLPFFLLLKSNGTGLYSTKDLALAQLKFDKFKIDNSVYVVGDEQSLHFQQVFKTLEMMGYERARNCFHLAYGMVSVPSGKMSSRKGNMILFSALKEGLTTTIRERFLDKYTGEWPEAEIEEAARRIAIATIRYGMLNQDSKKGIVFDMDRWTDQSGNTGPYMMYAYARTRSILNRIGDYDRSAADWSLLTHETEQNLLRRLGTFHEVVATAAERYEPSGICVFLYELAKDLSRMYAACSAVHAETETLKVTRAAVIEATGLVLRQGLALIGIETLERM